MNKVTTKDYPENLSGGIMICGINYGYSHADEHAELTDIVVSLEPASFFSDETIRKQDKFRKRILKWLEGWGIQLARYPGEEGLREKSFFQCNWLDTQTRDVCGMDKVSTNDLVDNSDGFISLLESRKPALVFLFGANLIEALNDSRIRNRLIGALGLRTAPENYTPNIPDYNRTKFKLRIQMFGDTVIVGCPHPSARGLTDAYMASIELPSFIMENSNHKYNKLNLP